MEKDLYVVGIGASAGGYDALKTFFQHLPETTGAAFVVIQHLSPKHESSSHKILAQYTNMPVLKVMGETKIEPNHVYVIPENNELKITDTTLFLEQRDPRKVINLAVDTFFETLAEAYKEKAIGIVLSGTGSDGSWGVQALKGKGGMVMVLSPRSASYDSMPVVAITSDSPDYIASPDILAKEVAAYINVPQVLDKEKLLNENMQQRDTLQAIIQHVSAYSGVNFKSYKRGTIIRRIEKRIQINHLPDLQSYERYLKDNPKEVQALYGSLLIGVTRFFRDEEAYSSLERNIIPELFRNKTGLDPVRIWTVACSSGEEAYSLAILLNEYISKNGLKVDFKIFATDLDQRAIETASAGRYNLAIEESVSPERLNRYFNKVRDFYEVKKDIRKQIIFSRHNILSDPPFNRIDLLSCRNLFIYLMDELQSKVLHNFSYSLNPGGYLFLGNTESINDQDQLFETLDVRNKLYKNKFTSNSKSFRPVNYYLNDIHYQQFPPNQNQPLQQRLSPPAPDEPYASLLAAKFAPASVIINQQEDVVYTNGNVQQYLQFPNRRTDLNIYSMLRGSLILFFRNGLRQLSDGESSILFKDCVIEIGNQAYKLDINFSILESARSSRFDKLYLVEFKEKTFEEGEDQRTKVVTHDHYSRAEIENLEKELKLARRELRFTSDKLETINEELQSANEELQSTYEELQSSNEELQAVNLELKNKIDTITVLHDDINNLFNSTQIATVFLDNGLNIRKFTPPLVHYFNIRESDVGRPITHYSYNFKYNHFVEDVKKVMEQLVPLEREIEHSVGGFSIMRLLPYKTESRQIKGVVVTFTDITELKTTNNKLLKLTEEILSNERHLKSLLDHTPDFIVRFDDRLRYSFVNRALLETSGLKLKDFIGKERVSLRMLKEDKETQKLMQEVLKEQQVLDYYYTYSSPAGEKHYYVKLVPEFNVENKEVKSILSVSTDITQLKNAEQKLLDKNKILSEIYDRMDNFVHAVAHDLRTPLVNLKMLADLSKQTQKEEEREEFMRMIGNSVTKLDNTLNGLIRIIEVANESQISYREADFNEITKGVLQEFEAAIDQHDVSIDTHFEDCPTISYADVYLNSILQNLISNAIKYRHPQRKPHISLSTTCTREYVILSVADNGQGFNIEAVRKNLFKPFKRFHHTTSGKGVGLYIIKYMIERNGGMIEVDSQLGEGTEFTLYLRPYEPENYTAD